MNADTFKPLTPTPEITFFSVNLALSTEGGVHVKFKESVKPPSLVVTLIVALP